MLLLTSKLLSEFTVHSTAVKNITAFFVIKAPSLEALSNSFHDYSFQLLINPVLLTLHFLFPNNSALNFFTGTDQDELPKNGAKRVIPMMT
jgi:hypothetical protein